MRLIVGGAYQGKLEYATSKYGLNLVVDGKSCTIEDTYSCEVLNNFQECIKNHFTQLDDVISYLDTLCIENPNIVIVSTEVGSGIVPIDKVERSYRELVGRACCEVSKRSQTVERVFCGLGVCLK